MDDELWKIESFAVKSYVEGPGAFTFPLKFFLKEIHSDDIEQLEKLKANVESSLQIVLDGISGYDERGGPDRVKKELPLSFACGNSEKEFYSILLSHVESRISEKKT